jgi:hypothetical protein
MCLARTQLGDGLAEVARHVARTVVGHDLPDADAMPGVPGSRSAEKCCCRGAALVAQHLDLGEPGRIVHRDVNELPADPSNPGASVAVDAMAWPADPPEFLHVQVDQGTWSASLVAANRGPLV